MFIKKITIVTGIAAISLFFHSCGRNHEETLEVTDTEVTKDTIKSDVRVDFDLIRVNIPSPGILAKKLSAAKIEYNKKILLPINKGANYSSVYQKAIALGAFGADMGMAA